MASHISMATDDDVKADAQTIKDHYGLSWEEYIKAANTALMPDGKELQAEPSDIVEDN